MDWKKDKNKEKEWEKDWHEDWDKDWEHDKEEEECNCRIKIEKSKVWIICDDDFDINDLEPSVAAKDNGTSPSEEE